MLFESLLKLATPVATLGGAFVGLFLFLQKKSAQQVEVSAKLETAVKNGEKLLAMECFSALYLQHYSFEDIKFLIGENDALRKITMLRKRRDAVQLKDQKVVFTKEHDSWHGKLDVIITKFSTAFFGVTLILSIFGAMITAKVSLENTFVSVPLVLGLFILFMYFADRFYWYRVATQTVKEEMRKLKKTEDTVANP